MHRASSEAVRDLQRKLTALGYPLRIDGIYGPATAEAVRRFQKDHALRVDGIAGKRTYAAIESSLPSAPRRWSALSRLKSVVGRTPQR